MSSRTSDPTFSKYTPSDSQTYAQHRQDYNPKLYSLLLNHHTSTGGSLNTLLDIGCGPGSVARALSPHFIHAWALDPSEGMIATARQLGGYTSTGDSIRFEVSPAETLDPIPSQSVDLIVSAAAAHWFNMPLFWTAAARILKPGGTVALWSGGSMRPDPDVFAGPQNEEAGIALRRAVDEFEKEVEGFLEDGNRVSMGMYEDLGLPWEVKGGAGTEGSAEGMFDREGFRKVEWGTGREGSLPMREFHERSLGIKGSDGEAGELEEGEIPLGVMEMALGTTSFVTRWREANPGLAGTEADVVTKFRAKLEKVLADAGMSTKSVRGGMTGFMLLIKRKADESG